MTAVEGLPAGARERLAREMARHRDVIENVDLDPADPLKPGRFRYGCTCGHERGRWTEREAIARIQTSIVEQRQHVADALLPVVAELCTEARADAVTDALMWSAWTVEHSPGIQRQAGAVNAIRARAGELKAADFCEATIEHGIGTYHCRVLGPHGDGEHENPTGGLRW